VKSIHGTDLSPAALTIAKANVEAAKLTGVQARFDCADFHNFEKVPGLGPNSVTLIITNPPMGRRVPVPNLARLIGDLFTVAGQVLKPGGRLVFANPLKVEPHGAPLKLESREVIDLGGFDCRLEKYIKLAPGSISPV
jgi:tRNA G10  N-methylase Trm11